MQAGFLLSAAVLFCSASVFLGRKTGDPAKHAVKVLNAVKACLQCDPFYLQIGLRQHIFCPADTELIAKGLNGLSGTQLKDPPQIFRCVIEGS